jgi:hypothetical protein
MNTTAAVLYAPTEYWSLPKELKQALTNGCGPRGWLRVLVPDTICGLDITKVYAAQTGDGIPASFKVQRVLTGNQVQFIVTVNTNGDVDFPALS